MKKIVLLCFLILPLTHAFAQDERARLDHITDSLEAEGKTLYRSEWASWYGTDIFQAKCQNQMKSTGGYFSYETADKLINIFFSRDEDAKVLAAITFPKNFDSKDYVLDTTERRFTATEQDYYNLRNAALTYMRTDTIFKSYKNTTLNLVPIIQKNARKVYVLTGTTLHGVVIFGNDYLMNLNEKNNIISAKALHKNIIPTYLKSDSAKSAFHTHLPPTDEFITATDICTLMLYEKFTTWETYNVVSKNYFCIWDCGKNTLLIMTMDAIKRIEADQKQRHPDKE